MKSMRYRDEAWGHHEAIVQIDATDPDATTGQAGARAERPMGRMCSKRVAGRGLQGRQLTSDGGDLGDLHRGGGSGDAAYATQIQGRRVARRGAMPAERQQDEGRRAQHKAGGGPTICWVPRTEAATIRRTTSGSPATTRREGPDRRAHDEDTAHTHRHAPDQGQHS